MFQSIYLCRNTASLRNYHATLRPEHGGEAGFLEVCSNLANAFFHFENRAMICFDLDHDFDKEIDEQGLSISGSLRNCTLV